MICRCLIALRTTSTWMPDTSIVDDLIFFMLLYDIERGFRECRGIRRSQERVPGFRGQVFAEHILYGVFQLS